MTRAPEKHSCKVNTDSDCGRAVSVRKGVSVASSRRGGWDRPARRPLGAVAAAAMQAVLTPAGRERERFGRRVTLQKPRARRPKLEAKFTTTAMNQLASSRRNCEIGNASLT